LRNTKMKHIKIISGIWNAKIYRREKFLIKIFST